MKLDDLIYERKEYTRTVTKNKTGSWWEKRKTKYDYSDKFDPGHQRIVTQIQDKAREKFDAYISRNKVDSFVNSDSGEKLFYRMEKAAGKKFSHGSKEYNAYLYGGYVSLVARLLSKGKQEKGLKYLL